MRCAALRDRGPGRAIALALGLGLTTLSVNAATWPVRELPVAAAPPVVSLRWSAPAPDAASRVEGTLRTPLALSSEAPGSSGSACKCSVARSPPRRSISASLDGGAKINSASMSRVNGAAFKYGTEPMRNFFSASAMTVT